MNIIAYVFIGPAKTGTSTCARLFDFYTEYVTSKKYKELYRHSHEYLTYYSKLIPSQNLLVKEYTQLLVNALKDSKQISLFEPSYISLPPKVLKSLPSDYIVLTLRDPVDRMYSHYNMDISLGLNNLSLLDSLNVQQYYDQYVELSFYTNLYGRLRKALGDRLVVYNHFERQLYVPKHIDIQQRKKIVNDFSFIDYNKKPFTTFKINPAKRLRFQLPSNIITSCLQWSQILPSSVKQKLKDKFYIQGDYTSDCGSIKNLPHNLQEKFLVETSNLNRALDTDYFKVIL